MLNDLPRLPPVGAVIERDGPIVRTHYGTHGEASHGPLPDGDLDALVARQVEAFARRNEPVVWPVYGDGPLAGVLLAAGFTPDPERSVLVCPIGTDTTGLPRVGADWPGHQRIAELAARAGPHRRPYTEFLADSAHLGQSSEVVLDGDRAAWLEEMDDVMVVGGVTDPGFAATLAGHDWRAMPRVGGAHPGVRSLLAEADGDLREAFEAAGMRETTTVTRYRLPSPGEPARTRPVRRLFAEPEQDEIWARFYEEFAFRPDMRAFPGITEPVGSATWHVGELDDTQLDALSDIVHKGLRAAGEELYWLDWHHAGFRFDPARVDGAGPRWPGAVFPDGDYHLYLTHDLRLGTFGHPWEETVCVWGELLTRIDAELTAALGEPLRRSEA